MVGETKQFLIGLRLSIRSEVCDEFSQGLGLDGSARLEGDVILDEFYCPLGEVIEELRLVKDVLQWKSGENRDWMALEIASELLSCSDQCQSKLL